jgi:hypothetical protein
MLAIHSESPLHQCSGSEAPMQLPNYC